MRTNEVRHRADIDEDLRGGLAVRDLHAELHLQHRHDLEYVDGVEAETLFTEERPRIVDLLGRKVQLERLDEFVLDL
jgi:hypothetical protein